VSSGPPESELTSLDSFLVEHIRRNPGLRYGAICKVAQTAFGVSRATVTRHLSQLVRFGDLVVRPSHQYDAKDTTIERARPLLEVRWRDETTVIYPDGTARVSLDQEFRVVSGELRHFDFDLPRPYRNVVWWCTAPSVLRQVPSNAVQEPRGTHRTEFVPPVSSRDKTWHRITLAHESIRRPYLRLPPKTPVGGHAAPIVTRRNSESTYVNAQRVNFAQRFALNAILRLQVVLPESLSIRSATFRVLPTSSTDQVDSAEQGRLLALGRILRGHSGFRKSNSTITLSVPDPKLNRIYEILWIPREVRGTR
jgi:hypothetical protein